MAKYIKEDQSADESVTLPTITEDQHNYDLGIGNLFRLSSDAERNITGIVFHEPMTTIRLVNVGEFNIVLQDQNSGSQETNLIVTGNGADVILLPEDTALLTYDTVSQCWRLLA